MGQLPVSIALHAESIVSRRDLAKSTFYAEYLAPQGLQIAATATVLSREGTDISVLAFQWQKDRDEQAVESSLPFQQRLVGHVNAALRLHDHLLELEQDQRQLLSAFGVTGAAVILCDIKAEVVAASPTAEAILARRDGLGYRGRRLVAMSHGASGRALDRVLRDVAGLGEGNSGCAPQAVRIPRSEGKSAYRLCVFPLLTHREERRHLLVFVQDPERIALPSSAALRRQYAFTRREAQIVESIIKGRRLADIAELLGVSRETVKSHLSTVFRKTNTRSQTELVASTLQAHGRLEIR
jgi:DNA-binding CsgD family transcriptional regulator